MPRAKPFSDSDEEEKTTIESQWEDEASTTVEQGDVADKIRSLVEPRREITSTGAGPVDEPTVDDQHAQMSAITPVRDVARLAITQGNDAGTDVEIRPGKTYTIGRAIDNDVVLTDIAVSRKHFDLRFEDAAWVIVDRGSGNGTVVNGNLEDNPFMLANGDVIEIGNTVFRFDQPNGASRPQRTVDLDADDEEMSTVAGKPMRADRDVEPMPAPVAARPPRPKTLPPPTPLRAAGSTQPPPLGFPPPGPASLAPQPASTMPMPQMANRPPLGSPNLPGVAPMPAMLGEQRGFPNMPNPSPLGSQQLPTTIPGQGAPPPRQMQMYPYPQATEIPPHSVHAQMLLIQTQNRRGDGSTAHVPPMSFDQLPQQRYTQPQLTKKAKAVLIGIGLAVFAAVMTVAIVKSSGKPQSTAATTGSNDKVKLESKSEAKVAAKTTNTVEETPEPAKTEPAKTEPAKTAMTTPTTTTPVAKTTPPPAQTTTVAKTEPAKTTPPATTTTVAKTEPVKTTPPPPVKTEPVKAEPVKAARTEPKKSEPKKSEPKATKRPEKRTEARRETQVAVATPPPEPKKTGGNPDAARSEAERLYRAKKFSDASAYLANQAKKFDEDIAKDMRRTSEYYAKLGRALAQGTAPATRAVDAFESLRSAQNYDRNLSNAFDAEIQTKLAQVAPKAALSYVATKNYPAARSAMLFAKQFPSATESVNLVKQKLESAAGELYNEAVAEQNKDKLKLILQIVDATSPWYKKAQSKLGS